MEKQKSIKIIYVIYTFVPDGSSIALLNLLDGLIEKNISPMIIMSKKGSLCVELEKRNIPYQIVPYLFARYYRFYNIFKDIIFFIPLLCYMLLLNKKAKNSLVRIVKEFNPDIIHTNIGPSNIGYKVAKQLGILHIWHIREFQGCHFSMRPFPSLNKLKKMLLTSYTIAISHEISNFFALSNKSKVIYDGVSKQSQLRFSIPKSNYFLFVGQITKTKGIEQLLSAYIEFAKENKEYELYIVGAGKNNYISTLTKIIMNAGLNKRVTFLGSRRDVFELMAKATAVIVPSFFEGFGLVVAEAMFNGCLVIGNDITGTKEQFDNGFKLHGEEIAIRYSGHNELVAAMQDVANNGIEHYFPMIKRAQETVSSLYTQERNVNEIFTFYNEILDNNTK